MRLRLPHAPYVANKIAVDLIKSGIVRFTQGVEPVVAAAGEVLETELKKEQALDERVREILDEMEDDIEETQADYKQLFWMIKKRLAEEYGVILNYEDKYNDLAHKILRHLRKKELIEYQVPDNKVKNIIYEAITGYIKSYDEIEDVVLEKMSHYKKRLIPGTEEFEIIFSRMFEAELKKRGMIV